MTNSLLSLQLSGRAFPHAAVLVPAEMIWPGAIISRKSAALHAGPVQIMPRPGASAHALRVTWTN